MAVPAVFRKYNEISLIKRILVGLAVGIVLALLIPNAQPWTDIITLLGSLFVGALKAVAPVLVFFLVISALCNAQGAGTMKTVVVLYVISTLVAAIVALIGSEIFPTSLTLDTSSMVEQAAPEGIGEVLTTLLMNIVANPVDALMNANYVGILAWAVVLGIALSIVLFILLPTLLAGLTKSFIQSPVVRNLFEGLLRIVIFLLYLWAVSHMKDVERMFAYHGAEHKTIFCYEKGLPLTVENVRPQSRFHPRCGTSFLFVVVIISILVFSLVSLRVGLWDNPWVRIGLRLLLLPVVVSISYEINRWVGRHDNLCSRILSAPGKWLQRLTTNEPDDSMIECAIRALELVIPEQKGSDTW